MLYSTPFWFWCFIVPSPPLPVPGPEKDSGKDEKPQKLFNQYMVELSWESGVTYGVQGALAMAVGENEKFFIFKIEENTQPNWMEGKSRRRGKNRSEKKYSLIFQLLHRKSSRRNEKRIFHVGNLNNLYKDKNQFLFLPGEAFGSSKITLFHPPPPKPTINVCFSSSMLPFRFGELCWRMLSWFWWKK